jgi:squalene-hopene/tetraprenyl-beta-curcumene cyclase
VAGDPRARAAAQLGLRFVAANATQWQSQHECYGCHVQAVTLEALTFGRKNQYDVPQRDIDTMLRGLLDLRGGAHQSGGLSFDNGSLPEPAKAFGGAALAHYDRAIDGKLRRELLATADQLTLLQANDGHVGDYSNGPVAVGPLQTTTQALETWRQAYERSADERWLAPIRRAEGFVHQRAAQLSDEAGADVEQVDYAIIGLVSAGASSSEAIVTSLAKRLVAAQGKDGAWDGSALVTGASLYALRLAGMTDADETVSRGTQWLIDAQGEDGGWSHDGRARGGAMWAVLGLATLDVLSVEVSGVTDGAHLRGTPTLHASARDNSGAAIDRVDLLVDDVPLASRCGAELTFPIESAWLADGSHSIDVVARNARGQTSKRRLNVYAGAYFLTELGTRYEDGGTTVSVRDLAPKEIPHVVELRVFATRIDKQGGRVRGAEVRKIAKEGAQGPARFFWDGKDGNGAAQPAGPYVAELRFVTRDGSPVQTVETPFVHDTPLAQAQKYAEVEGRLDSNVVGQGALADTDVELVDKKGHVVQRVRSTKQGSYRFKDVEGGDYDVRVSKAGFAPAAAPVHAAPAASAAASIVLKAE